MNNGTSTSNARLVIPMLPIGGGTAATIRSVALTRTKGGSIRRGLLDRLEMHADAAKACSEGIP